MTRYRTFYDTPERAVAEALFLGLMAHGESEEACGMLAEDAAERGLNEQAIELCKATALERFEAESGA